MSDQPTPETDNERTLKLALEVFTELANTLKRERDEANEELHKQLVRYDQLFDEAEKIRIELAEAREIAHDLAVIASHCLGSHSFSLSETSERIADTLKRWRSTQPCKK
jgi:hypothetical protein